MNLELRIGRIYTFNTYAPTVIGQTHTGYRLEAILSYREALLNDPNILQKHTTIIAYTSTVTQNELMTGISFKFLTPTNEQMIFHESWIIPTSVQESETQTIDITVAVDDVDATLALLRAAKIGYSVTR